MLYCLTTNTDTNSDINTYTDTNFNTKLNYLYIFLSSVLLLCNFTLHTSVRDLEQV